MSFSQILVGITEIEVDERAADGDMADTERRCCEIVRLPFETIEHRRLAHGGARFVHVGRVRAHPLIAQQHQHVQKSIAERLAAQRREPRLGLGRMQLWRAGKRVEIVANHRRIVDHRAVVEHQRRNLRERIILHQRGVGLGRGRDRAHAGDAVGEPELMDHDHDLADERRAWRPVQLHRRSRR